MPIYDYQCSSCGFKKEVMRKISEPNLTVCPECGKETFTKQLSAPSFQLSGSGWYATDFKDSGKKKTDAKPEDSTSEKSEKKTESTDGFAAKTTAQTADKTIAKPAAPAASDSPSGSQPG